MKDRKERIKTVPKDMPVRPKRAKQEKS